MLLPTNASVLGKSETACFEKNARRRDELRSKDPSRRLPQDDWLCYWNADLVVEFERLLPPIRAHLRRMRLLPPAARA